MGWAVTSENFWQPKNGKTLNMGGHWEIYCLHGVERDGILRIMWNFGCESIDLDKICMQAPVRPSFVGANFQLGRKGPKVKREVDINWSANVLVDDFFSNGGSIFLAHESYRFTARISEQIKLTKRIFDTKSIDRLDVKGNISLLIYL